MADVVFDWLDKIFCTCFAAPLFARFQRAAFHLPAVAVILLTTNQSFAAWASHGIISGEKPSLQFPVAVEWSDDKNRVEFFIPVGKHSDSKGFFLIRSKERLPKDKLEMRSVMWRWTRYQEVLKRDRKGDLHQSYEDVAKFEEMTPIAPETRDGVHGIFLDLDKETANRTYLVYDFLPWGGFVIRDGGLWLTYDLPSFAESFECRKQSRNEKDAELRILQIRDVQIDDSQERTTLFRVRVAKEPKQDVDRQKFGTRMRVWERGADGNLSFAQSGYPEWDGFSEGWEEQESKVLIFEWNRTNQEEGKAYYGFSVDVFYDGQIEDSWSSDPELLTHLLAFENLGQFDTNVGGLHPHRVFNETYSRFSKLRRSSTEESRSKDMQAMEEIIEIFEELALRYGDDPDGASITRHARGGARDAKRFLASLKDSEE